MKYVDKSPDEARARQAKKEDRRENAAIAKAQAMYEKLLREGKSTPANRQKMKDKIANKTGAYPMGGSD
jgi:hypothetical protein